MSEKYKGICKYLNYVEHLLILVSTVTGCVFNFCIYFIGCYSCKHQALCIRDTRLCSHCRNQKL